jgi:hypothetical protein
MWKFYYLQSIETTATKAASAPSLAGEREWPECCDLT